MWRLTSKLSSASACLMGTKGGEGWACMISLAIRTATRALLTAVPATLSSCPHPNSSNLDGYTLRQNEQQIYSHCLCLHLCPCMCICMHVSVWVCMHMGIHVYLLACVCVGVHAYGCACVYACVYVWVCMHMGMQTLTRPAHCLLSPPSHGTIPLQAVLPGGARSA